VWNDSTVVSVIKRQSLDHGVMSKAGKLGVTDVYNVAGRRVLFVEEGT